MSSVDYELADGTPVRFEFESGPHFRPVPVSGGQRSLERGLGPLMSGAMSVVNGVRQAGLDGAKVRFGIKLDGDSQWLISKSPEDSQFQVEVTWSRPSTDSWTAAAASRLAGPVPAPDFEPVDGRAQRWTG